MPEADIYTRLGNLEGTTKLILGRLDKMDDKLDHHNDTISDIKHIKNNIAMLKKPVDDYERVKQRGIGMWTVVVFVLGGSSIAFNVISYVVRVYILKIGVP